VQPPTGLALCEDGFSSRRALYEPAILWYAAICGFAEEIAVHPWATTIVPPLVLGVTV
jgi:hypothetical protein